MTNAAPLDVLNTTVTAVVDSATTDGTIATGLYEVEKLKRIVDLVLRFEKEEKSR